MFNPDKLFFTSDTHFYHTNSIIYDSRPFSSVDDMNEQIIEHWNQVVPETGVVFHLGDFGFKVKTTNYSEILNRLNGKIILIEGNHDKIILKDNIIRTRFHEIHKYYELKLQINGEKQYIVMSHFPFYEWNRQLHGSIHLHGHIHFKEIEKEKRRINVFSGLNKWSPFSLEQILEMVKNEK